MAQIQIGHIRKGYVQYLLYCLPAMLNFISDDLFLGPVELSYSVFKDLGCISDGYS